MDGVTPVGLGGAGVQRAQRFGGDRLVALHTPVRLELVVGEQHLVVERADDAVDGVLQQHHALLARGGAGQHELEQQLFVQRRRHLGVVVVSATDRYDRPAWFLDSARRYDGYERKGPKVFMGEYAAQSDKVVSVLNRNNWECALAEAAFMTGLERNGEVVVMSSYAS